MLAEECISNLRDCLTLLLRYSERSDIRFYVRYSTIWSVYDLIITESDPCILLLVTVINTRTKSGNHGWISRDSALTKAIHPSIVCIRFIPFYGVAGFLFFFAGTQWTSRQLITGPSLVAEAAMQGANNLGFSFLLKDTSTCSSAQPGAGIWTSDLPITSQPAKCWLPTTIKEEFSSKCSFLSVKKERKNTTNSIKENWFDRAFFSVDIKIIL